MTTLYNDLFLAEAIGDLDDLPLVKNLRGQPFQQRWGGATYEVRNHVDGWVTVIRAPKTSVPGHPAFGSAGWDSVARTAEVSAVLHHPLEVAEIAFGRALFDAVSHEACAAKGWDDDNRVAVAPEPGSSRWGVAWMHNGRPGFSEHDSWSSALTEAAQQLDAMAESSVYLDSTWTSDVAAAHLRRCANQIRGMVLTAELGDAVRSHRPDMKKDRSISKVAACLDVERSFLYRVFDGKEWVGHSAASAPAPRPSDTP